MSTGQSRSLLSISATSRPPILGIMMSRMVRSGRRLRAKRQASSPSSASPTTQWPSCSSIRFRSRRCSASSSAMSIFTSSMLSPHAALRVTYSLRIEPSFRLSLQRLHFKANVHDIAIFHDILFAFEAHLSGGFGLFPAATGGPKIVEGDDLGANEAAGKVGVNLFGGSYGVGALRNRPGAYLILTHGKKADQAQRFIGGADETISSRFGDAERLQELLFFLGSHLGDFHLGAGAERDERQMLLCGELGEGGKGFGLFLPYLVFADIGHKQQWLAGDKSVASQRPLFFGGKRKGAHRLHGFQMGFKALQHLIFNRLGGVLALLLARFLEPFKASLYHHKIGKDQLLLHLLGLAQRVKAVFRRRNPFVLESTHHEHESVHKAHMGKEVGSKFGSSACRSPRFDAWPALGKLDGRRGGLLRAAFLHSIVESRIGHGNNAHVNLFGVELT